MTNTPLFPLLGTATALLALSGSALAATIPVTTSADAIDTAGDCSLREAVIAANTNAAVDACPAGSAGEDTIVLPAGVYVLELAGADEGWEPAPGDEPFVAVDEPDTTMGDLDVLESLVIQGDTVFTTLIRWGEGEGDRIFQVAPPPETSAQLRLEHMTLANGTVGSAVINEDDPPEEHWIFRRFGGAVAIGAGSGVKLLGSSGPSDDGGPSDEEESTFGTGSFQASDVMFLDNYAGGDAGALFSAGELALERIWFEGNVTAGNGGALYQEGSFGMTDVAFIDNEAEGGGAMFASGPTTGWVKRVLFEGNYATGGGALSVRSLVVMDVYEAVVVGNEAFDVGGGFYSNGLVRVHGSSFVGNLCGSDATFGGGALNSFGGGEFELVNTAFAGNMAGETPANCGCTGGSCSTQDYFVSIGHNLEDADTCGLDADGDMVDTDARFGLYGGFGGAFDTIVPLPDSPLLEAGFEEHCGQVDARGLFRPQDGDVDGVFACDIGAVELSPKEIDWDGDGYCEGQVIGSFTVCSDGSSPGDCAPLSNGAFPGNAESCDGIDNDCNGEADDGLPFETWYFDRDGDGYGDLGTVLSTCDGAPTGYVANPLDCDDDEEMVGPEGLEICNAIDDDCDGLTDDEDIDVDLSTGSAWYADQDGDGYGDAAASLRACEAPEGYVADDTDCNDAHPGIHPGQVELIDNGIDDDCDGFFDQSDPDVDVEEEACGGCATGTSGPAAWLGLLGLVGLALRRRR